MLVAGTAIDSLIQNRPLDHGLVSTGWDRSALPVWLGASQNSDSQSPQLIWPYRRAAPNRVTKKCLLDQLTRFWQRKRSAELRSTKVLPAASIAKRTDRSSERENMGGSFVIVEYTRYKIDEERCNAFEQDYKKAGESLAASTHCLAYELSRCKEDPEHYILRIEWDSEEGHLKGFRSSPEFKAFFAVVQPYVKDIEEMRHYQVISVLARAR
jgi:quinol monooxygenase YgiN